MTPSEEEMSDRALTMLGIETSCDETAAAVVRREPNGRPVIVAERVLSQIEEHRPYEGVVPEIAARAHIQHLDGLVADTMADAGLDFAELDAVAATGGPGLIGGVMVGVTMAKAVAAVHGLPFVAVNHLEGHALSVGLTEDAAYPFLLLLVSGGHCQLQIVRGPGDYAILGATMDDAVGEAFDKVAKLIGLGYPGGPAVETAARNATNPDRFDLPRPLKGRAGCDFSFSGLKTAVRHAAAALPDDPLSAADAADLCAAFQSAVADSLEDRCRNAIAEFKRAAPDGTIFAVAGGVAANALLRQRLSGLAEASGLRFVAPEARYCTDNAAMIAWAGAERFVRGWTDALDFSPRPRWPLDSLSRRP